MKRLLILLAGAALALSLILVGCTRDSSVGGGGHALFTTSKDAVITVATSNTLSAEVDLEDYAIVGMILPATWTAANVEFVCAATSGGTTREMFDSSNTQIAFSVTQARAYDLGGAAVGGCRWIKLQSSAAQAADRTVTLILGR